MSGSLLLTVFSLNCWGIPWFSKDRVIRMNAIASQLNSGKFDIVCLQEVWSNDDFDSIKEKVKDVLPFAHYFFSGVIGSGVCIFSKYPIKSALFHQWSVNGYVHKIQHGDWFGGKGIGLCKIDVNGRLLNVYTAHLHAEYDPHNDEYLAHRVVQAFDTAQFIKLTSSPSELSIIGGDLNTEPKDLAYRIIKNTAELRDAHDENNEYKDKDSGTNEAPRNSYTPKSVLKDNPQGKRIDYILYRPPQNADVSVEEFGIPLPPLVPGQDFSYSDHEALSATLRLEFHNTEASTSQEGDIKDEFAAETEEALLESVSICDQALTYLKDQRFHYTLAAAVTLLTLVIIHYLLPVVLPPGISQLMPFLGPFLHIICVLLLLFSIFMATIWNCMEINGILAGKVGMAITLGKQL